MMVIFYTQISAALNISVFCFTQKKFWLIQQKFGWINQINALLYGQSNVWLIQPNFLVSKVSLTILNILFDPTKCFT